jgi:hypothetical protein
MKTAKNKLMTTQQQHPTPSIHTGQPMRIDRRTHQNELQMRELGECAFEKKKNKITIDISLL